MKKSILLVVFTSLMAISIGKAQTTWPQKLYTTEGTKITVYQPQSEDLKGNILTGRAAISVMGANSSDPVFGVCWFKAVLLNNNNSKVAEVTTIEIKQLKIPDSTHQFQSDDIIATLQSQLPTKNIKFDVTELNKSVKQEQKNSNPTLNNNAPYIIYRTKPSTLVVLDGAPKFELDTKFNMERIINTPSLIVRNPQDNLLYFYRGGIWYSAADISSKWSFVKYLPMNIQKVDDLIHESTTAGDLKNDYNFNKATTPSDIIVSTSPAELIQTEGEVTYQSIEETNLLYADNSLDDIFKDVNSQQNFILVSGRWYSANSLNGPWTYVPANQLPQDFAKIPEGSEKDGVLTHVAGTDAANEAVMNAQIPQTAKVDRRTATCNVSYEGDPSFTPINGTSLMVAENSSITVLKSGRKYYAVDNGIWFVSQSAYGPWTVSTDRPYDVDNIPADNIAYNTRYVYVYDVDPDYVWMGYTPGYTGCYIYGPTVVWGTGWYYNPWYHHHYYSRPYTWGFGMQYNPWYGWGLSYNMWPSIGWGWYGRGGYGGGWFGPRYYRPCFNSWGYNGGFYGGYGNYYMRQPRVNFNRPANFNNNLNGRPMNGRNNFAFNNGTNNIYHRVNGVHTNNITLQPYRNNFVHQNNTIGGRPNNNPNINNHINNGFKPGQNQMQQHMNVQERTENMNGNSVPRSNNNQIASPHQNNNGGGNQLQQPNQGSNSNQQQSHQAQQQQNSHPRNVAPPRNYNLQPRNPSPSRSGNSERGSSHSESSGKGGSGKGRGR